MPKTYFITGAEGVGKTTILKSLIKKFPNMKIHDFDEIGVPENPPLQWRLDTTLFWIREAIKNHRKGLSTCIIGLSFPSEIVKYKESRELGDIVFILLDVNEKERKFRLSKRGASREVVEDLEQRDKLREEFENNKNKIDTSNLSEKGVVDRLYNIVKSKL